MVVYFRHSQSFFKPSVLDGGGLLPEFLYTIYPLDGSETARLRERGSERETSRDVKAQLAGVTKVN